jgi:hypothetical protein
MRNILGQWGQISPIQDNSHKEMGCQPAGVSGKVVQLFGQMLCTVPDSLGDILGGAKSPCPYLIV